MLGNRHLSSLHQPYGILLCWGRMVHLSLFPGTLSQTRLCCTLLRKEAAAAAAAAAGHPGSASVSRVRPHVEPELQGDWCVIWPCNLMAGAEISVPNGYWSLPQSTGNWRISQGCGSGRSASAGRVHRHQAEDICGASSEEARGTLGKNPQCCLWTASHQVSC